MKRVTIKDVAMVAGVSIATVSNVLNEKGYVSQELQQRVLEAVKQLNYQVNANARSLKAAKTNKVAVIVPDISNVYMMSIAKAIEDMISPLQYHLLFMSHNESAEKEAELLQLALEQRVDGIVLMPIGENAKMIETVLQQKIPVVIVDRKVSNVDCDLIVNDNYYGSQEAIKYLHSLGHQRVGVIGELGNSVGKERFYGAVETIAELGMDQDDSLFQDGKLTVEHAYKSTLELLFLPEPPTAIYCCNNKMTLGMLKALQEQNVRIPDDLSVICFGDASQWELFQPPLTMIGQPQKRLGIEAAIILKNRLIYSDEPYQPKQIVIRPELLIRSSCSKPKMPLINNNQLR